MPFECFEDEGSEVDTHTHPMTCDPLCLAALGQATGHSWSNPHLAGIREGRAPSGNPIKPLDTYTGHVFLMTKQVPFIQVKDGRCDFGRKKPSGTSGLEAEMLALLEAPRTPG